MNAKPKTRRVIFTDNKGNTHEFKTPTGPRITAIIFAKYPDGVQLGTPLADGMQAMIITQNLEAERIARNHTVHHAARDLEIITDWKEI